MLSFQEKQKHYFANKGPSSQGYGFSSGHVWTWELDYKESWALKNWCFWTVVLEKTLESPLESKIKPVNPKGNQPWLFIGRTDPEAEAPVLWPPDAKSWLIRKDLDARKNWRQEEKGVTEDEMVGWHYWFNGHEFEQTPWDSDGQRSLACCGSWGHKESDINQWLNNKNEWNVCHFIMLMSLPKGNRPVRRGRNSSVISSISWKFISNRSQSQRRGLNSKSGW